MNAFLCRRHHPDFRSQREGWTEGRVRIATNQGTEEGDREGDNQSDPFRAIDLKGFKTTEIGGMPLNRNEGRRRKKIEGRKGGDRTRPVNFRGVEKSLER